MKITVIHGQSHKGSTYNIAKQLCDKLGGEVTEFFLPTDFDYFCKGCAVCFTDETKCPHYEKLLPITKAMDEADVIILTSPVYVMHATGSMKAFLDHYGYRFLVHRPEEKMFKKQLCFFPQVGRDFLQVFGLRNFVLDGTGRSERWHQTSLSFFTLEIFRELVSPDQSSIMICAGIPST